MGESFGIALAQAMQAAGFTQVTFAHAANISQGQLSRILNAERRPPLDVIPEWLDILKIHDLQRNRLLLLADMAHAPPRVGALVERLINALATAQEISTTTVLVRYSEEA